MLDCDGVLGVGTEAPLPSTHAYAAAAIRTQVGADVQYEQSMGAKARGSAVTLSVSLIPPGLAVSVTLEEPDSDSDEPTYVAVLKTAEGVWTTGQAAGTNITCTQTVISATGARVETAGVLSWASALATNNLCHRDDAATAITIKPRVHAD